MNRIWNLLKALFGAKAQDAVAKALKLAPGVLPYLEMAARAFANLTPTPVDNMALDAWRKFRAMYPKLTRHFTDEMDKLTDDERKLAMMAIAAHMVEENFPGVSTNIARMAVEIAYANYKR